MYFFNMLSKRNQALYDLILKFVIMCKSVLRIRNIKLLDSEIQFHCKLLQKFVFIKVYPVEWHGKNYGHCVLPRQQGRFCIYYTQQATTLKYYTARDSQSEWGKSGEIQFHCKLLQKFVFIKVYPVEWHVKNCGHCVLPRQQLRFCIYYTQQATTLKYYTARDSQSEWGKSDDASALFPCLHIYSCFRRDYLAVGKQKKMTQFKREYVFSEFRYCFFLLARL